MLAKTNCEHATTKRFKAKLKPYHHHFDRCSKAVAVHHGRSQGKVRLGDLVTIPDSDLHHVMDADAMLAISYAIEDIAGEERQGELIATFYATSILFVVKVCSFLPLLGLLTALLPNLKEDETKAK